MVAIGETRWGRKGQNGQDQGSEGLRDWAQSDCKSPCPPVAQRRAQNSLSTRCWCRWPTWSTRTRASPDSTRRCCTRPRTRSCRTSDRPRVLSASSTRRVLCAKRLRAAVSTCSVFPAPERRKPRAHAVPSHSRAFTSVAASDLVGSLTARSLTGCMRRVLCGAGTFLNGKRIKAKTPVLLSEGA